MRAFNLEEAKAGKPLVTRDGRDAKFIAHVPECIFNRRVLIHVDKCMMVYEFPETGLLMDGLENSCDIFMKTVKKTVYANLWDVNEKITVAKRPDYFIYETEKMARNVASNCQEKFFAIAVPIEIEE
jgi:hypothetical protein